MKSLIWDSEDTQKQREKSTRSKMEVLFDFKLIYTQSFLYRHRFRFCFPELLIKQHSIHVGRRLLWRGWLQFPSFQDGFPAPWTLVKIRLMKMKHAVYLNRINMINRSNVIIMTAISKKNTDSLKTPPMLLQKSENKSSMKFDVCRI